MPEIRTFNNGNSNGAGRSSRQIDDKRIRRRRNRGGDEAVRHYRENSYYG